VGNPAFDPSALDYSQEYDNALHHSAQFRRFEQDLARQLVTTYHLKGATFLEVGCGDGHFLELLTRLARGRGFGFDPSAPPERAARRDGDVRIRRAELDRVSLDFDEAVRFDLACLRQVLEHLAEPAELLEVLGDLGRGQALVWADVPNGSRMLRDGAVWELMYEHVGYYTASSLRRLFQASGYATVGVRAVYEDQFLGVMARHTGRRATTEAGAHEQGRLQRTLHAFDRAAQETVRRATQVLRRLDDLGRRAVVWGAGARTTTYLNLTGAARELDAVVDSNPNKHGTFVAGTGHPVVAPASLPEIDPQVVVLTNPVYTDEVGEALVATGVRADLISTVGDVLRPGGSIR
jgi:SAM-dependent methyltransferase